MSTTEGEVVLSLSTEPKEEEQAAVAEAQPQKPVKGRKAKVPKEKKLQKEKAPKEKKAREAPAHPPYFQMIKEALTALHEKSGSSAYAIAKYMEEKHKDVLPANYKKMLALQLKNCTAKGKLIKIKASFKLSESGKKEKEAKIEVAKKPKKAATPAAVPKAKPVKKASGTTARITRSSTPAKPAKPARKAVGRKMKKAPAAKAKQPKSIKSPAAKRARRAAARN